MRFLDRSEKALEEAGDLRYPRDRDKAIVLLLEWQKGFCAYSERYLNLLDSEELEHFDLRLKGTDGDGIKNWYAVLRWLNAHKYRKIADYEPLPDMEKWSHEKLCYERGQFVSRHGEPEVENLIRFLGVNRREVFEERRKHVARIKRALERLNIDKEKLGEIWKEDKDFSFPTALEAELGLPVFRWIEEEKLTPYRDV